jgi:hypothetical protein
MRLTRLRLCFATLAFCLPHLLGAQGSLPVPLIYDPNEGLIRLDVFVSDRAGKPIPGIERKDFTLLENGQPQKILTFHAYDGTSTGRIRRRRLFSWSIRSICRKDLRPMNGAK